MRPLFASSGLLLVWLMSFASLAQTPAPVNGSANPPEVSAALPQAQWVGKARLKVWGFDIYDATLWSAPGFSAARYASHPLALELVYLRDFAAADIAERSIKEMRRSGNFTTAQAATWMEAMRKVFPDVKKGDRILGQHRPGVGTVIWFNGKLSGEIADPEFSRLFFGIWLSPGTSEPAMRAALLAGAAP
ncbi:MAG: chalcone isomerase family protein [Pseudomonadota bacterium]